MPEGPEIRRAADKLAKVLEGSIISNVEFGLKPLAPFAAQLAGQRIVAVETRGKALLNHFDHGLSVYSHNQLYGVWKITKGHDLPPSSRSLRLLLQTAEHSACLYSASDISVWPTDELLNHPFLAKIGPDIMDPKLHWRDIVQRLLLPCFVKRQLGMLYLDQAFLAGNGNYLRSEILHLAQLHPRLKPQQLSRQQLGQLARLTLSVAQRSYESAGITLAPRLSSSLKAKGLPRSQRRFYVFSRQNKPCFSCGAKIKKIPIASRRLYFCPQCQPLDSQ